MELFGDDQALGSRNVAIAAGGETELTWTLPAGYHQLRAALDGRDALPQDDDGFLSLVQSRPVRALLVSATPDTMRRALAAIPGVSVSVIDSSSNTVVANVPVGSSPTDVAVNAAGTRAYVAVSQTDSLAVVDTASNTVVANVPVGTRPDSVAVNPAGSRVYVTNRLSNTVSVVDAATNVVLATIAVGLGPQGIAVSPDGSRVYVALFGFGTAQPGGVAVVDAATNTVLTTIR